MVNFSSYQASFFTSRGFKTKKEALTFLKQKNRDGKSFHNHEDFVTFIISISPQNISTSHNFFPFEELCDDIIYIILKMLDLPSLYYLSLTSKNFYKLTEPFFIFHGGTRQEIFSSIPYKFRCYHELFTTKQRGFCSSCQSDPYYKLITATTAIKKYGVKRYLLNGVDCLQFQNPHYRNAAPMRLFLEREISVL